MNLVTSHAKQPFFFAGKRREHFSSTYSNNQRVVQNKKNQGAAEFLVNTKARGQCYNLHKKGVQKVLSKKKK